MINIQTSVSEIADRVLATGRITAADQQGLLSSAQAGHPLSPEDEKKVQQVLKRLKMGLLRVV
jgi:hypothetical protein